MHNSKKANFPWIENVKSLLCSLGFAAIWYSQSFINSTWLVKAVNRKLKDQFIQNWLSKIDIQSDSNIYRTFKLNFEQSNYISILPLDLCKKFLAFRTRNHKLPVEIGRWRGVPYNERICTYCYKDIGDEFHVLLICERFKSERTLYIKPYYYRRPNILKFEQIMNTTNRKMLFNLVLFVKIILKTLTLDIKQ